MKNTNVIKQYYLIFSIIISTIILDQLIKLLIIAKFQLHQSTPLIKNIFHLTYVSNTGAGFGIFHNNNLLLICISIMIIGLLSYLYNKFPDNKLSKISFALIIGGAIGNLIDRIRIGFVVDYLDFKIWPAFNLADSAITIGAIILIILIIKEK